MYVWGEERPSEGRAKANTWQGAFPLEDKGGDGFRAAPSPVGCFPANGYGLYDMAGNVWQWASDITVGIHDRPLKGGSKAVYGYNLRIWTRNAAPPDYASPSVGFRCAR